MDRSFSLGLRRISPSARPSAMPRRLPQKSLTSVPWLLHASGCDEARIKEKEPDTNEATVTVNVLPSLQQSVSQSVVLQKSVLATRHFNSAKARPHSFAPCSWHAKPMKHISVTIQDASRSPPVTPVPKYPASRPHEPSDDVSSANRSIERRFRAWVACPFMAFSMFGIVTPHRVQVGHQSGLGSSGDCLAWVEGSCGEPLGGSCDVSQLHHTAEGAALRC